MSQIDFSKYRAALTPLLPDTGDVLAYIKEQQGQPVAPDVKTNSDKNGYRPRGRKPGRRTDFMNDPAVIARRLKALSQQTSADWWL